MEPFSSFPYAFVQNISLYLKYSFIEYHCQQVDLLWVCFYGITQSDTFEVNRGAISACERAIWWQYL